MVYQKQLENEESFEYLGSMLTNDDDDDDDNNNNNNLLQLGCHPVAVIILHVNRA